MIRLFRLLIRIATGLILLGVIALGLAYFFASRSLPDYDATHQVAGVTAPVEIVRDNANVPHIFGETDADVVFALGFAHAQDRLWQMTMLRRTVQGRLSELFGRRTYSIDVLMRRLGLYQASLASVSAMDADSQALLRAYAAGVNAWIAEVNKGAMGRGAPEMWVFNHPISPWQPADSVAIIKLMAVQLSGQVQDEVLRARLSLLLNDDARLSDILPDAPGPGTAALPEYAAMIPGVPAYIPSTQLAYDPISPVRQRGLTGASNAWAAAQTRSATEATLLANDPHLGLSAPGVFYLARLELEAGGVIGGTIPGVPLVMTGRNSHVGWGLTTAYLDDQDVFVEEVSTEDASLYRTPNGWAPFETRESIILIKDEPAETISLKWTENGPVLSPDEFDLGTIRPPGHVTALGWTALSKQDTTLQAGFNLMRARSVREAIDAAQDFVAPAQMLTLADRNHIGLKLIGAMPQRNVDAVAQGRMPQLGYLSQNRWEGIRPYEDNPEWVDPEGGIVGNTNNKILDAPFPDNVSFVWGDTQRINRWHRLMQAREVHTRESFIDAQLDTVSFSARALLPLIGSELWFTGEAAPEGTPLRLRQDALRILSEWNGEMNEHLPEPLIYAAWVRALQARLITDELGPLAQEFPHVDPLFIERVYRDIDGASAWCDIKQSAPVETCADISKLALDDALVWIGDTYGTALESLRWGDAHEATHDHPVLGDTPFIKWFVNIRQSTSGGDNTLMRGRTSGTGPNPFENVHAAAYRGVYDFADPDSSVFVIPTGQSGHFLSRYYDDLGELWRRGEYIPMSLDPALARGGAVGITHLLPEGGE